MDHHQASDDAQRRQSRSASAALASPSTAPVAAFRSQRITQRGAVEPHVLLPPPAQQGNASSVSSTPTKLLNPLETATTTPIVDTREAIVGNIRVLPSLYILERTATQISAEQVTLATLLDRIFTYLRVNSVAFQCDKDTGCFDCILRSPISSVGFVIQLWRASNKEEEEGVMWMEVQRRQGCCIEMNSIRRSLVQHVLTGEEEQVTAQAQGLRRRSNAALDGMRSESNKRPKILPAHTARLNCQDSLAITVQMLESPQRDQQKLGLEALAISTNSTLVSPEDATVISRALVGGEGPLGGRLQQRLTILLRQVKPQRGEGLLEVAYYQPGSMAAVLYNLALQALANALERLFQDQQEEPVAIDLCLSFWQTVVHSLIHNLEEATVRPHEAALSAKCVHHLLKPSQGIQRQSQILQSPLMQRIVRRAHEFGQSRFMSLEQEAQKLLRSYNLHHA